MKLRILLIATLSVLAVASCKTTEENYRSAYEKAVAGRDSAMALDKTIYGAERRNIGTRTAITATGDTAEVRTARIKITEGGGGSPELLKPYNVVVGQFKQLVNSKSLRERLVAAGFADAFVVETAEPFYYIILNSYASEADAIRAASELKDKGLPIAMRPPCPFVLKASGVK